MIKPSLLRTFVKNDGKSGYAGTVLGHFWAYAAPLVTIGIYWFVYTIALHGTEVEGIPYLPWLTVGFLPWFFLSAAWTGAASCLWDYRFLLQKIRFPAEELPLIRVCSAWRIHLPLLLLSYGGISLLGIAPQVGQCWIFLWVVGGFLFALGWGQLLAVACSYLRDVSYILQVALQLGFWLTPIFWHIQGLPPTLQSLIQWNPVAILVEGYRSALLWGRPLSIEPTVFFWGQTVLLCLGGRILLRKTIPTLSDRL